MSRFFVAPEQIGAGTITIDNKNDLHHMKKVLRLQPGDEVDISDGTMWEYRARIDFLDAEEAQLTILDKQRFAAEPLTEVTLYQGIPKQGKMETIIQKCVELGVHRIVPVFMDRTVVVDKGNFNKKIDRWQKVSAEAVKQCRRGIIPEVSDALRMPQVLAELTGTGAAVNRGPHQDAGAGSASNAATSATNGAGTATPPQDACPYDLILIPYENEDGTTIKDVLREHAGSTEAAGAAAAFASAADDDAARVTPQDATPRMVAAPRRIAVLIGPEGGFSQAEVDAVIAAGGHSVSLGKTTLRTETAGMAALAMIMYEMELA